MKAPRKSLLALALMAGLSVGTFDVAAKLEVSASVSISAVSDFYTPLGECGTWVQTGGYGRCWRPGKVKVGWRPYCAGEWVWTDCGWYWESDEPWAWACYHYGSWVHDSHYGWIWLPGVEWGPAWVSWRFGGGYIGWAPLAPRHVTVASVHYVFVRSGHLCDPVRPSRVIVNNRTVISKTVVVGGIKHETRTIGDVRQRVVVDDGPKVELVEKAAGKKLRSIPVREMAERTHVPAAVSHDRSRVAGQRTAGLPKKAARTDATPTAQKQSGPERNSPGRDNSWQNEGAGSYHFSPSPNHSPGKANGHGTKSGKHGRGK